MVAESAPRAREGDRILVTGALGFVASRLIPRLLGRGNRVAALVRPGRDATRLEAAGVEVRRADLSDPAVPAETLAGAKAVVHLAGLALVPGFLAGLEAAEVRHGVFVSSAGVHTRLESRGADAKRRGEATLRSSAVRATILRPSMIYGLPGDRNLERLLRWLARFPVVPVPGGGFVRQQPVHVDDLVSAILAALDRPATETREYDVGGPESLTLRELIEQSALSLGRRALIVPLPLGPTHAIVAALRRLRLPTPVRPEQILRLQESKAVDITPARRDLGFAPRPFAEGIRVEADLLFGHR